MLSHLSSIQIKEEKQERMKDYRTRLLINSHTCNFVFTDEIGRYINYCSINVKLKKLLKENGLPIVTPHALRHTNASLMVNSGVDLKAVSAQLGHCNISITADTYGHIFDVYKAKIAKSIEDKLL